MKSLPRHELLQARTAEACMAALCRFIELWRGPRKRDFGEPAAIEQGKLLRAEW